jgi:HK97 family phage major capsid protein
MAVALDRPPPKEITATKEDFLKFFAESNGWEITRRAPDPEERSFVGFLNAISKARDPFASAPTIRRWEDVIDKVYGTGYETSYVQKAAMAEESGVLGGYLVPPDYTAKLLATVAEESFIFPRANQIPMRSVEMWAPRIDSETTQSAGKSPFYGGLKAVWGSGQAPTESEPTFRQDLFHAWDLLLYANVSNQFLTDIGPTGEEYLIKLFGKGAAWYAEYAFLQGTGSSQLMPEGIVNSPAAVKVSRAVGNQISNADIANMVSQLMPYSWKNAIWATNPSTLAQIVKITNFFLNVEANPEGGQAGTLMTRPLFITEKLATLGTSGDLLLFDPSLYTVGMRQEVLIDVSNEVLFQNAQTMFRVWMRLDGKPQLSKSITLADGSTVVSAYVILV